MKLEGIHHITAITADAPGNLGFYAGTMGLRLVKKTVNQDDPTVYHLFFADEAGSPGADLTFFEYPRAGPGIAGVGMVHRIVWRVGSEDALSFWEGRLLRHGIESQRTPGLLEFNDPEGLGLALKVSTVNDQPLMAERPEIPAGVALQGFDGVRAYSFDPDRSRHLLEEALGFRPVAGSTAFEARGGQRGGFYVYDEASERGLPGAGTVHHVAWASPMADHEMWQRRLVEAGARPTPVIDRFYFRSVYFREPSGVLFEIATIGPGFATDEDPAHLGESLSLPPAFEHLRDQLDGILTPLPDPRRNLLKGVGR